MYIIILAHWMHLNEPVDQKITWILNTAIIGHQQFYEKLYIFYVVPKWMLT